MYLHRVSSTILNTLFNIKSYSTLIYLYLRFLSVSIHGKHILITIPYDTETLVFFFILGRGSECSCVVPVSCISLTNSSIATGVCDIVPLWRLTMHWATSRITAPQHGLLVDAVGTVVLLADACERVGIGVLTAPGDAITYKQVPLLL